MSDLVMGTANLLTRGEEENKNREDFSLPELIEKYFKQKVDLSKFNLVQRDGRTELITPDNSEGYAICHGRVDEIFNLRREYEDSGRKIIKTFKNSEGLIGIYWRKENA